MRLFLQNIQNGGHGIRQKFMVSRKKWLSWSIRGFCSVPSEHGWEDFRHSVHALSFWWAHPSATLGQTDWKKAMNNSDPAFSFADSFLNELAWLGSSSASSSLKEMPIFGSGKAKASPPQIYKERSAVNFQVRDTVLACVCLQRCWIPLILLCLWGQEEELMRLKAQNTPSGGGRASSAKSPPQTATQYKERSAVNFRECLWLL